jgi:hypothetical protein
VFTESTHIVAVKTTGNVYCYQALQELCIKPKNWKCVRAAAKRVCASHTPARQGLADG